MKKACYLDGCGKPAKCRGLCTGHYERWRLHGDAFDRGPLTEIGAAERFVAELLSGQWPNECIFWAFARMSNGYPTITVNGATAIATWHICKLARGEPPTEEHHAAHTCGKGHLACVNPAHLVWKTAKENASDKYEHGTDRRGEKHPSALVREADVVEIRRLYALGGFTYERIGKMFGMEAAGVGAIVRRDTWRHVA